MNNKILSILVILSTFSCQAFIINRAIVASDSNSDYLDFWPIVAKAWTKLGIRPTLALIASRELLVDESLGDVIRFEPIGGISDGLYAQTIRLLLPILYENEVSLISDIDMIPISPTYFTKNVVSIPDNMFVVFRNLAYGANSKKYPMCYNAAKGSTFKEIFGINSINEIPSLIYSWAQQGMGWSTDELILYAQLQNWKDFDARCVKLSHTVERRIDRADWKFDSQLLNTDYYIDCHCLRPYKLYKKEIDNLSHLLSID